MSYPRGGWQQPEELVNTQQYQSTAIPGSQYAPHYSQSPAYGPAAPPFYPQGNSQGQSLPGGYPQNGNFHEGGSVGEYFQGGQYPQEGYPYHYGAPSNGYAGAFVPAGSNWPGPTQSGYASHTISPPQDSQVSGYQVSSGQYQYSTCQGSKRALLVGINYIGHDGDSFQPLNSCHNDVWRIHGFLSQHGFGENITVLVDQPNRMDDRQATCKYELEKAMRGLVYGARPNDSLVFFYSGHGLQIKATEDRGEEDGMDECIVPSDYRINGYITDNWMHEEMVRSLQPGVRLTAIFDSCHSGTAMDLPFIYSTQGILKQPRWHFPLMQSARNGLQGQFHSAVNTIVHAQRDTKAKQEAHRISRREKVAPADVVMFSGAKDSQKATQVHIGGLFYSAMTTAFVNALEKHEGQSYKALLNNIRNELEDIGHGTIWQLPQLSCCHELDTNQVFIL